MKGKYFLEVEEDSPERDCVLGGTPILRCALREILPHTGIKQFTCPQ